MRPQLADFYHRFFKRSTSAAVALGTSDGPFLVTAWARTATETRPLVFLGDSLTYFFGADMAWEAAEDMPGSWQRLFREKLVAFRGVPGDRTDQMLARLQEVTALHPKKIFVLAGVNNLAQGYTEARTFANYRSLIDTIETTNLTATIYIESTLPTMTPTINAEIRALNAQLRTLASRSTRVHFIDLYPMFVNNKGILRPELTWDGVHLLPPGDAIWAKALRPSMSVNR